MAGQIADGNTARYISGDGLEYNQAVGKALIGALLVDQICNHYLSPAVLDAGNNIADNDNNLNEEGQLYTSMEHKWDEAYGYLYGAASDVSLPLANLSEDDFLSKYLTRVDEDEDFNGIAQEIFDAYKTGRAAIVAGDYVTRDKQAEIIKEDISEVIAIRAVYYLQSAKTALQSGQMGSAFHDLSEGYGFIYSLRFTRQANSNASYFTKDEVENFIAQLTSGNGFWDVQTETLDEISKDIADKFTFTIEETVK